jgi:hypothetical protein
MASVSHLIKNLSPDPWRNDAGFSAELHAVNEEVFDESKADAEIARTFAGWLARHQPCLFGRMAAGPLNLVTYCVLTERDLSCSDTHIRDKIQEYRLLWRREAFLGKRSAFVILAVSPRIAYAAPDPKLMELARRICFLYLRQEIAPDEIYHDRITLEVLPDPGTDDTPAYYEWRVGANVFCAQGDGRWWMDHRIPGGIAFSMNSVGHMARNGQIHNHMLSKPSAAQPVKGKLGVDSLAAALKFAMLTINGAQQSISGKATFLTPLSEMKGAGNVSACPLTKPVPPALSGKDHCSYSGWYHTDVTVPSDYFRDDVERPASVGLKSLDFTYLLDDSIDNPEFETTGLGGQTR